MDITCYKCLQKGHTAKQCKNRRHPDSKWQPKKVRLMKANAESVESNTESVARAICVYSVDAQPDKDDFIRIPVQLIVQMTK